MSKIDIKVGDLVKLRDNLKFGNEYGLNILANGMKFKGFKKVTYVDDDGQFNVEKMNFNYCSSSFWYTPEMIAEVKRLCQYRTIYKREEPILDDKEKEYLSAVIKPFKIEGIVKRQSDIDEYICIYVIEKDYTYVLLLPYFKKGTRYKGMELNKEYTLKELGL